MTPNEAFFEALRAALADIAAVTLPCAAWLAHGPALVRAAPLEEVRLSDKQPISRTSGPEGGLQHSCAFYRAGAADLLPGLPDFCRLPAELFDALPGARAGGSERIFPDKANARAALSAACLGWARATPIADCGLRIAD